MIAHWTQSEAVNLCRFIEDVCPKYGCHVALTGGLLYKTGDRKDCDILFYRIRGPTGARSYPGQPGRNPAVNFHRHIGFTGTRHGMTAAQLSSVATLLQKSTSGDALQRLIAHHGLCVGADLQFHRMCRSLFTIDQMHIVGHPGPDWPHGNLCARVTCDETRPNYVNMKRNQHIVDAADIMIATPAQDVPQWLGGTWATIRMAIRAMEHVGTAIDALYVIGHDGRHMDYAGWKL